MSWFLGIIDFSNPNLNDLKNIHCKTNILHSDTQSNVHYEAGGIPDTCRCIKTVDSTILVLGTPIINSSLDFVSNEDLINIITTDNFSQLTGAFSLIMITKNTIKVICDSLNLRKLYYYQGSNQLIIGTDLVWIKKMITTKIDIDALGVYWTLNQAYSNSSLYKNIKCINGTFIYSLHNKTVKVSNILFTPLTTNYKKDITLTEVVRPLEKLISNVSKKKVSLGLSGGVDSRTILAMMLHSNINFTTHTFGESQNYDVKIAGKIAKHFNFENVNYNKHNRLDADYLVQSIRDYTRSTEMSHSFVSIPMYDHLAALNSRNLSMIMEDLSVL